MTSEVRFKDFTDTSEPIRFRINDDVFEAPSVLPVPVMQQLASAAADLKSQGSDAQALESIVHVFDVILVDESATLFRTRVNSKANPVGIKQIIDIMMWLLEVYGLRPTDQSSVSSDSSETETAGMPSTDGAPSTV
jgi:hypothetical protein